jgi:hypothetical protein
VRRSIPEPHLTDRRTIWRAAAGVLALLALVSVIEGFAARRALGLVLLSSAFSSIGTVLAGVLGPWLRPRPRSASGRSS